MHLGGPGWQVGNVVPGNDSQGYVVDLSLVGRDACPAGCGVGVVDDADAGLILDSRGPDRETKKTGGSRNYNW